MGKKTLKWGLLSTARINAAILKPVLASPRHAVLAVASRDQARADAFARQWRIGRAFGSYEQLLEDPEIDIIYNPLPNHLHAQWTIRALDAGKHVLCEKPIALSTAEVDAIAAAAERAGRTVCEAFMYRHLVKTLKAREIVQSGKLGQVKLVRGSFSFTLKRPDDYRHDASMGGGSLWDVGCYPVSYMRYIIGAEPLEVFGWQEKGPKGADESFAGQLQFPGGIVGQFDSSFALPFHTFMEIVGTAGTLNVPAPFKGGDSTGLFLTGGDKTEKINLRAEDPYAAEVEEMAAVILEGRAPRISLADSRGNTATLSALYASARSGQAVRPANA